MNIPSSIRLPEDLTRDKPWFESIIQQTDFIFEVSSMYLMGAWDANSLPEVVAIQRFITLAQQSKTIQIRWPKHVFERVYTAPNIFPLLAVALCLDNAGHSVIQGDGTEVIVSVQASRQCIYKYRLATDIFADSQVVLCVDSRGHGRPLSLYTSKSGGLLPRANFQRLADRLLAAQQAVNALFSYSEALSQAIASLLTELLENTDIHGTLGLDGAPIKRNGIRGVVVKRIRLVHKEGRRLAASGDATDAQHSDRQTQEEMDALDISVFDSGIGLYASYARRELTQSTSLDEEWRIMHRCLERHYATDLRDAQLTHEGKGLYEVLRATKSLHGIVEIRSGRTYGFRTFLGGEHGFQLQSRESGPRSGLPKPVLLDLAKRLGKVPTAHEKLAGTSVRVLIPLK
jgi:hypothetical protein